MRDKLRLSVRWNILLLVCWLLLILVTVGVNTARRARRKPTRRLHFTKKKYDATVQRLLTEKRYEDYAKVWMRFIVELENNVTHQIFHPGKNGGEKLCNDMHLLNLELETVLIPLKQEKEEIVYIARKIYERQGPKFLFELLPNNAQLKKTFEWNNYQLSRFYKLWLETRMIWEEFKEAYLTMKVKCYYLRKL
ncbi:hypothetical protein J6590_048247 [Homalodisca vitripennis]|nr:hypothetical protein J6590_048247 [Homalodisca vitripennis]